MVDLMRGVIVLVVASACANQYTVDEYFSELANAHCTAMEFCCTRAEYTDWWTDSDGDRYDCYDSHASPPFANGVRNGIKAGRIQFDPDVARSCVIALESLPCDRFEPAIRFRESYCESPFHGVMPVGAGPCNIDQECASGHCGNSNTCVPGVPPGGACSTVDDYCDGPYRCQSGTCGLGLPPGSSCNSDDGCADDWCKDDGIFTSGTCTQACDGV